MNSCHRNSSRLAGILVMCSLVIGMAQAAVTSQPASGDQPDNPGPLATDLSPAFRTRDIEAAMRRVADWQVARVRNSPSEDWTYATLYVGLLAAADTLHDPSYRQVAEEAARDFHWELGPRRMHADDQAIGQSYLELYRRSHKPYKIGPLRRQFDEVMQTPDNPDRPVWWWCDALFMAPPVWAGLSHATGDRKYNDYMDHEWSITQNLLYDPRIHLFARDANYLDKHEANGQRVFWSRGNGWVMGGTVRVLAQLPSKDPSRQRYIRLLREMAKEVASIQSPDGLWRPGLLDPQSYPLPEISGSAFFVYAIAWGVDHGYLDEKTYGPVLARAWNGMLKNIYQDGRLGCIQPVGEAPGHYKASSSYVFGVGAFLLAGSELELCRRCRHPAEQQ